MRAPLDFATPADALRAMVDAGAIFTVRRRPDALGMSFTYTVAGSGDLDRCRAILVAVKSRPVPFYEAFKAHVQDAARVEKTVGVVSTTPTPTSAIRTGSRDRGAA